MIHLPANPGNLFGETKLKIFKFAVPEKAKCYREDLMIYVQIVKEILDTQFNLRI